MYEPFAPKPLKNGELEQVLAHSDWKKYGGKCPTCEDTGTFRYKDEEFVCPDDDYGHVRTRLFQMYLAANIPEQYQVLIWDEYPHPDVKQGVEDYLTQFKSFYHHGMGLELLSRHMAVGKTWAATHVLREVVKLGYKGWFVDFVQMKDYYELPDHQERVFKTRQVREVPVLVIDDVRKPVSPAQEQFFSDQLESVIRERTNNNLVTIMTSNLEPAQIEKHFPRVYSLLSAKTIARCVLPNTGDARSGIAYETNEALALMGERRPVT